MSFQFAIEGAGVVASVPGFVYESTACGICRRWQGDEVAWLNPLSRWAHEKCVKQIESVESKLTETTNELFKGELNNRKRQIAHLRAIEAVSARCVLIQ